MCVLVGIGINFTTTISITHASSIKYPDWHDEEWIYRRKIQVSQNPTLINQTVDDFPLLVTIKDDLHLANYTQSDGSDIFFTSIDSATKLHHEIEHYDSTAGDLVAHVLIPSISPGKEIYMYYGNSQAPNRQNPDMLWSNYYIGVWHMNETTGSVIDSSPNNNHGTAHGGLVREYDSLIGNGYFYNGSNSYVSTIPISWQSLDQYTMCVRFKPYSFPAYPYRQVVVGTFPHEYSVLLEDNQINLFHGQFVWTGGNLNTYSWNQFCHSVDRSSRNLKTYLNGNLVRN